MTDPHRAQNEERGPLEPTLAKLSNQLAQVGSLNDRLEEATTALVQARTQQRQAHQLEAQIWHQQQRLARLRDQEQALAAAAPVNLDPPAPRSEALAPPVLSTAAATSPSQRPTAPIKLVLWIGLWVLFVVGLGVFLFWILEFLGTIDLVD